VKVFFILYLLGKSAFVSGPLHYGVGECWARGNLIMEEINEQAKGKSFAWDYSCLEMKVRPKLNRFQEEIEGPLQEPLDKPSKGRKLGTGSWENRGS